MRRAPSAGSFATRRRALGMLALGAGLALVGASSRAMDNGPDATGPPPDGRAAPDAGASDAAPAPDGGPAASPSSGAEGEAEGRDAQPADAGDDARQKAEKRPRKDLPIEGEGGVVYRMTIDGPIDRGLPPYAARVLDRAAEDPEARAVVTRIRTPGGRVDAAVRLRDLLLDAEVPTIAWIDAEAISAGALIALAHDRIAIAPGGTIGAATPIKMQGGDSKAVGEKMVSYVRGVFRSTAEAKERDPVLAAAMVDADVDVPGLAPKGKLLTATSDEALEWGLVDAKVADRDALHEAASLSGARVERIETNWGERIARILTGPTLSGLLMSLGMLGLMMELYSPGFGWAGGLGLACLAAFFFGHMAVHLAGMEEVLLFAAGVGLLLVELFVTPGLGIPGVLGAGAILAALVLTLVGLPLDVSLDTGALSRAVLRVLASMGATILLMVLVVVRLARTSSFQRLVLGDRVEGKAVGFGADAAGGTRAVAEGGGGTDVPAIGARGVTRSALRPSGKVRVDGRTFDALSSGDSIGSGTAVEVRGTRGSSLLVRPLPTEASGTEASTRQPAPATEESAEPTTDGEGMDDGR